MERRIIEALLYMKNSYNFTFVRLISLSELYFIFKRWIFLEIKKIIARIMKAQFFFMYKPKTHAHVLLFCLQLYFMYYFRIVNVIYCIWDTYKLCHSEQISNNIINIKVVSDGRITVTIICMHSFGTNKQKNVLKLHFLWKFYTYVSF